jgi:hypothetical protein
VDSTQASPLADGADERPRRRARLLRPVLFLLLGSTLVAGAARGWDAIDHDHDGGHGVPARPSAVEKAMTGPFRSGDGSAVAVLDASCTGEGKGTARGYTHFACRLILENGDRDDVVVHLLDNDELFFKASLSAAR